MLTPAELSIVEWFSSHDGSYVVKIKKKHIPVDYATSSSAASVIAVLVFI